MPNTSTRMEELIQWAMIRMDELRPNTDHPEPIKGIENELNEAARRMLRELPRELLLEVSNKAEPMSAQAKKSAFHLFGDPDNYRAFVGLPGNFVRFLRIKLKGWRRDVDTISLLNSTIHIRQNNKYTRATANAPICFLTPWFFKYGDGVDSGWEGDPHIFRSALECFPYINAPNTSYPEVEYFYYVPLMKADELPETFQDALVWLTASLSLSSMREYDAAGQALAKYGETISGMQHGLLGEYGLRSGGGNE